MAERLEGGQPQPEREPKPRPGVRRLIIELALCKERVAICCPRIFYNHLGKR